CARRARRGEVRAQDDGTYGFESASPETVLLQDDEEPLLMEIRRRLREDLRGVAAAAIKSCDVQQTQCASSFTPAVLCSAFMAMVTEDLGTARCATIRRCPAHDCTTAGSSRPSRF